jgi:hypothetical protein
MPTMYPVAPFYGLHTPPQSPDNSSAKTPQAVSTLPSAMTAVMDLDPLYRLHIAAIADHAEHWRNSECRMPQMVNDPLWHRLLATGALILSRIERTATSRPVQDGPLLVAAAMRLAAMINIDHFSLHRPSEWNDVYEAARLPERGRVPRSKPGVSRELTSAARDDLFYTLLNTGLMPYAFHRNDQGYCPEVTQEEYDVLHASRLYMSYRMKQLTRHNHSYASRQTMLLQDTIHDMRFNAVTGYSDNVRRRDGKPAAITEVERELLAYTQYNLHVTDAQVAAVTPVITAWLDQYRNKTKQTPLPTSDVDVFAGYVVKRLASNCLMPKHMWPAVAPSRPPERPMVLERSVSEHLPRREGQGGDLTPVPGYPYTTIDPHWLVENGSHQMA